jgi:hypothetical protein
VTNGIAIKEKVRLSGFREANITTEPGKKKPRPEVDGQTGASLSAKERLSGAG